MNRKDLLRIVALGAVLLAGSCAAPMNDEKIFADGIANHPITVEPGYRSILVSYAGYGSKLRTDDETRLEALVEDYLSRGNGSISVSVPAGPGSDDSIRYFGERLVASGVPQGQILVGTHDAPGDDRRVEIGYVTYVAHTEACGDWSENAADTASNLPMPDFGCATQHNVAAMVADPRDLVNARGLGPADATRRATMMGHYEKGEVHSADKRKSDLGNEQSGAISEVH